MTELKYRWLIAGQVVTTDKKGVERQATFNGILTTKTNTFSRQNLAEAHQLLMQRFVREKPQIPGAEITDAIILSVSNLGATTDAEFHAGFPVEHVDKPQTSQELN